MGGCAGTITCNYVFHWFVWFIKRDIRCTLVSQVEIPGAKGKPAVIVNKDDGIDKVILWL